MRDEHPSYPLEFTADNQSAQVIDNSVNKPMPWLVLCGIISGLALGLSIGSMMTGRFYFARATVSENHWRDIEVKQGVQEKRIADLEKQNVR